MELRVNPRTGSLAAAVVLAASFTWVNAQQRSGASVAIDADDIGGLWTFRARDEAADVISINRDRGAAPLLRVDPCERGRQDDRCGQRTCSRIHTQFHVLLQYVSSAAGDCAARASKRAARTVMPDP